jgi:hypothetical protein
VPILSIFLKISKISFLSLIILSSPCRTIDVERLFLLYANKRGSCKRGKIGVFGVKETKNPPASSGGFSSFVFSFILVLK